jgi:hypothetical protein
MPFTITVDGIFEGPDRASCRTTFLTDDSEPFESYLVVAGLRVWIGDFAGYQETALWDPAALNALATCPGHQNYWEVTRLHRIPVEGGVPETFEGIAVVRKDLAGDPAALKSAGFVEAEVDEIDRYEMLVAADGGWPVAADIERSMDLATALALFGMSADGVLDPEAPATVVDRLRISRIDDPEIRVELPLLAG